MVEKLTSPLASEDVRAIRESWEGRCRSDSACGDTFVGTEAFIAALGRMLTEPQFVNEGPPREWSTETGRFAQRADATIGVVARHLLHLEAAVGEWLSDAGFPCGPDSPRERASWAVFWALEGAARELASSLDRAAHRDELTSLLNRRAFERDVGRIQERASVATIAVVDLDGLKIVNDSEGHDAGDALIVKMGAELSRLATPGVNVYRWGGDEFAVLAAEEGSSELSERMRSLRRNGEVPFSFGVAEWPRDDPEWSEVERLGDERMYQDKRTRKGKKRSSLQNRLRWFTDRAGAFLRGAGR